MTQAITSRSNPGIKRVIRLLSSSKERRENGLFVVEGLRLCADAVLSGYRPAEVYYTPAAYEKNKSDIDRIAEGCEKVYLTDKSVFDKLSDTLSPQGILCVLRMPENRLSVRRGGKYIALCSVSDPANVGAVSRTAEALGLDGMIVSGGCDIYNPKALRASMGALLRMSVLTCGSDDMFSAFRENGIKTYASTPRNSAEPLSSCDFSGGCAVLIGNEANGLDEDEIRRCDRMLTIPMAGRAESLNAAAAAAIIMYEMTK